MGENDNVNQGDKTSEGQNASTSTNENPTFTTDQVNKMVSKARSDALAEVGRLRKATEDAIKSAQMASQRLQKMEEAQLRAEEESAKDDPAKLSALQLRRQAQQRAAEVEAEKQKLEAERSEILTQRQEIREHRAEKLAEKYSVDTNVLLKYGGESKDAMEELAKSFGERKPGESMATRTVTAPDSGRTKGGSSGLTVEQVKKMSPQELNQHQSEIAKMSF